VLALRSRRITSDRGVNAPSTVGLAPVGRSARRLLAARSIPLRRDGATPSPERRSNV
jgi:hypothetical protein